MVVTLRYMPACDNRRICSKSSDTTLPVGTKDKTKGQNDDEETAYSSSKFPAWWSADYHKPSALADVLIRPRPGSRNCLCSNCVQQSVPVPEVYASFLSG